MRRRLVIVVLLLALVPGCEWRPEVPPTPAPSATAIPASEFTPTTSPTLTPAPTSAPPSQMLKVVFHPAFRTVYGTYKTTYDSSPAAEQGRMQCILDELAGAYETLQPEAAAEGDLRRIHTQRLIDSFKWDPRLFEIARLAAGGAILAAELATKGEVTFALVRPPGHHARADSTWGFCYFNNIAIAVKRLLDEKKIESALIVDFDMHYGDGTASVFDLDNRVVYYHLPEGDMVQQLKSLEEYLNEATGYDILAVSAGFDRAKEGWGGILETDDYRTIGKLLRDAAKRNCQGRRFAVFEGGYKQEVLGENVKAFLEGFQ